jgi:hypothetical protein
MRQSGVLQRKMLGQAGFLLLCGVFLSACGGSKKDEPQLYTVSASSGSGGSISPGSRSVQSGQTTTFTVTPDTAYSIASVTGCNGSLSGNTYTTGAVTSACSVQASFSLNSYSVTASAGEGGSISPGSATVNHGSSTSFSVTPDEGYLIESVSGCSGSLQGATFTSGAITSACHVTASFALNSYTIAATASAGGRLSPDTLVVSHGEIAEFAITVESGYTLATITGCNGSVIGDNYRTAPITAACSVQADFAMQVITGELPDISGNLAASIVNADEAYFHSDAQGFIPVTGHAASPVQQPPAGLSFPFGLFDFTAVQRVAGGSISIALTYPQALPEDFTYYKFGPTTKDAEPSWYVFPASQLDVSADRKTLTLTIFDGQLGDSDGEINGIIKDPGGPALQQQYNVTATAGEGGSISPGSATVSHGATTSFTVTPQSGYSIANATGCNGSLSGNTYTTGVVTSACAVEASFSLNSYAVTATAGEGGSISPGSATVNHGAATSFTVTPEAGYSIASVTGCNGSLSGNTYTTGVITSACSVQASFSLNSYAVTATAGEGGSISPGSATVNHGAATSFTVTPEAGYSIASVTGCNGSLSGNTYTTGAITSACSVQASFSQNNYTVTATAGAGGSISPGSATVSHGATTSFTVTPQASFSIASVTGCNGSLSGNTYTTGAITAACSVTASFNQNSYMVTAIASAGGQITPGSLSVLHGQTAQFSVVAEDNYRIVEVSGCGGSLDSETFTTSAITAACTINASFAFVPIGGLNDTGIDWCANGNTNNLNCPVAGFEGQDGDFGRDAQARADTLTKIGGGAAGFDYTKIAADGSVLAIQDAAWDANGTEAAGSQWSCVRDNVTGMIWEIKTADGGLRDRNHTYSWYNPDSNTNGGSAGTQSGGQCTGSDCDTHAFVQAVNGQGLCGATDWRMPTMLELMSIVNNGQVSPPAIDTAYFPNTPSVGFWSSSPHANYSDDAWYVYFYYGHVNDSLKYNYHQVRLVRAGQ